MRSAFAISILFILSCNSGIDYPEGGYDYVKDYKDEDTNFYFLPVRDSFSREDSFYAYWEGEITYNHYDEPNLSLQPEHEDIFRLTYHLAFGGTTIIVLKKDSIITKQPFPKSYIHYRNDDLLNEIEKEHLNLLERYYPLENSKLSKRHVDSLVMLFPQLLDPRYYLSLSKKTIVTDTTKPRYLLRKIAITDDQYYKIISDINKSGYWSLPVHVECIAPPMDGFGYWLETNTKNKYNIVFSGCCDNQRILPFAKACQAIVKLAGFDKDIFLYWDGVIGPPSVFDTIPMEVQDVELEKNKS